MASEEAGRVREREATGTATRRFEFCLEILARDGYFNSLGRKIHTDAGSTFSMSRHQQRANAEKRGQINRVHAETRILPSTNRLSQHT